MKKLLFVFGLIIIAAGYAHAQVAVIVNKGVPGSSLDAKKLEAIYSMDLTKWDNGVKIVLFDQEGDSKEKKNFYGFINCNIITLRKIWMRKQLTGEGNPPQTLPSEDEILDKVSSTPGAIGFVSADKVNSKVKVLLTIN